MNATVGGWPFVVQLCVSLPCSFPQTHYRKLMSSNAASCFTINALSARICLEIQFSRKKLGACIRILLSSGLGVLCHYIWINLFAPLIHTLSKFHCLIHELCPTNQHSSLERAIYGTSCLLLAFLNHKTYHRSNLRSLKLI